MSNKEAFAGGVLGGMAITLLIFGIIYYILLVIAGWKVFEKAGEKGWKSLIPIYNSYLFYKICGMKRWFWASLIISFGCSLVSSILTQGSQLEQVDFNTVAGFFSLACTLFVCVFSLITSVVYALRTSKVFGHGVGFALGLFFFSGIFLLILGFGASKYDKKLAKELGE